MLNGIKIAVESRKYYLASTGGLVKATAGMLFRPVDFYLNKKTCTFVTTPTVVCSNR